MSYNRLDIYRSNMSLSDDNKQLARSDKERLSNQACDFVRRIHSYFVKESENGGFLEDPNKVYSRTKMAARITGPSIARIVKEGRLGAVRGRKVFQTPGRYRPKSSYKQQVTCFTVETLRQRVYSYYLKYHLPCNIVKLVQQVRDEGIVKNCGRTSLSNLLKNNGFVYKRYSGRIVLLERDDVVIKRCRFFKKIKNVDLDNVLWVGETSVRLTGKKGHHAGKVYKLIIFHAGTRNGFLKDVLLVRPSTNKSFEYEKEISTDYFGKWFDKVLENIPIGTDIVMNVTPCHNAVINKPPNLYSDKQSVVDWLKENKVPHEEGLHKAELLDLVRLARPIIQNYCLERTASQRGYNVIRAPPYHDHFNALETIWLKVKNTVKAKLPPNNYDASTLEQIVREVIDEINPGDWAEAVETAKESITKARILELELDAGIESVFKHIDAVKKSGREDLENLNYHNDMSDLSEYFTESSDENNSDTEGKEVEVTMCDNQSKPDPRVIDREVTVSSSDSSHVISSSTAHSVQSSDNSRQKTSINYPRIIRKL